MAAGGLSRCIRRGGRERTGEIGVSAIFEGLDVVAITGGAYTSPGTRLLLQKRFDSTLPSCITVARLFN